MIISDKYRFVYVQVPHTGSTGLGKLLIAQYGGREVLRKHSYLDELKGQYPNEFDTYYIVGAVRNPLDERVSTFSKLKSNHLGLYSGKTVDPKAQSAGWLGRKLHKDIVENDLDFSDYLLKYVKLVYANPILIHQDRYDRVLRFETLDDDVNAWFRDVGAPQLSRVERSNPTAGRSADFAAYYSPEAQRHAMRIFSEFMQEWGYSFPQSWAEGDTPNGAWAVLSRLIRRLQWKVRAVAVRKQSQ